MGDPTDPLLERYGRSVPAGAILYQEGDPADEVYVVHSGYVRVSTTVRGLTRTLHEAGPGAVFGETALIMGRRREATAVAVEESRILDITRETFESMVKGNAEIAVRLIRKLASRLVTAHREIHTLLYRDPAARLASWLLDNVDSVTPPIEPMAAILGLRPGQVSELLTRFIGAGMLAASVAGPKVVDAEELRRYLQYLDLRERFDGLDP